jgi:hypothetical protein
VESENPVPIAEPRRDGTAIVTVEFQIMTLPTFELPPEDDLQVPIQEPSCEAIHSTHVLKTNGITIKESDAVPLAYPAPTPEPENEVTFATVELRIVRLSIFEVPSESDHPDPIPEPSHELPFSICELETNRMPIDDIDPQPSTDTLPIPKPANQVVFTTVEFRIVTLSIVEIHSDSQNPVPILQKSLKTIPST